MASPRFSQVHTNVGDPSTRRAIEDIVRGLQNLKVGEGDIEVQGIAVAIAKYLKSRPGILKNTLLEPIVNQNTSPSGEFLFERLRIESSGVEPGASGGLLVTTNTATGSAARVVQEGQAQVLELEVTATRTDPVLKLVTAGESGTPNYIQTDATMGATDAHLTYDGVWTDGTCAESTKEDIRVLDGEDTLEKVGQMRITRFKVKRDPRPFEKKKNVVGPMLEELRELFALESEGVAPTELASLAISAAQGLKKRNEELEARVARLENKHATPMG